MKDTLSIPRSVENVKFNIDLLNKLKVDFQVQHGTYTTTIITKDNKVRYMMNKYNTRVFKCASMIKADVLNSKNGKSLMEQKYLKTNYGFSNEVKSYHCKKILNIDITSAYATCLLRNELITKKTYTILKKLPKTDRLPCVGMLATSHTKFTYKNGECTDVSPYRSKTAPIFFFLIDEINYIMQNIQLLLGDNFIFYWVDGVFFDYNTNKECVKDVENFLTEMGYEYKYEDVTDFNIDIDDTKMMLQMQKKGISKQYVVSLDNVGQNVKNYINEQIKNQKTTPKIND